MPRINLSLVKTLSRPFTQFDKAWQIKPKPRASHIKVYEALPPSLDVEAKDRFDYPLRSRASVEEYLRERPKKIEYQLQYEFHLLTEELQGATDRFVKAIFNVNDIDLTPKQRERLVFLCGDRYNKKTGEVKIRVDGANNKVDNYKRLEEIMHELYMESLRAP